MKKAISIFLAMIFLISSIGVSFAVGYCPMAKHYSFSLDADKKTCCCKTTGTHEGCCKSLKLVIKKIEDRYVSSSFHLATPDFEFIAPQSPLAILAFRSIPAENTRVIDDDPPERSVPLNILYRSILI